MEPPKIYGGKAISNKCLEPFVKDGYSFRRCYCNRELIRIFKTATGEAHLPILSLVLGKMLLGKEDCFPVVSSARQYSAN